jgi:hypothetical protein
MGPEKDVSLLRNETKGEAWTATGIGYGVRGSRREDLTIRLQGELIRVDYMGAMVED